MLNEGDMCVRKWLGVNWPRIDVCHIISVLLGVCLVLSAVDVLAQEADPSSPPVPGTRLPDPDYILEDIELRGDFKTREGLIYESLDLEVGQRINVALLQGARLRLLSTGYFKQAQFGLKPGKKRGHVIVQVRLEERNTILLSDAFMGSSRRTPFWGGLDVVDGNLFGTGHTVRGAFIVSNDQWAVQAGWFVPALWNSRWSLGLRLHALDGRERGFPVVLGLGPVKDTFNVDYRRLGGAISIGYTPLRLLSLFLDVRSEAVQGRSERPELTSKFIAEGDGVLSTVKLAVELDTRDDPLMPSSGLRINVSVEGSLEDVISDYGFVRLLAFSMLALEVAPGHILRLDGTAGAIFGDAPFFERFFVGDVDDFIPGRNLGLNLSTRAAVDFFNTGADQLSYEMFLGRAGIEYAVPITNRADAFDRLEFFLGAALFGATTPSDRRDDAILGLEPSTGPRERFPIDLSLDLGLRVETALGIFGLSFANGLALVPL